VTSRPVDRVPRLAGVEKCRAPWQFSPAPVLVQFLSFRDTFGIHVAGDDTIAGLGVTRALIVGNPGSAVQAILRAGTLTKGKPGVGRQFARGRHDGSFKPFRIPAFPTECARRPQWSPKTLDDSASGIDRGRKHLLTVPHQSLLTTVHRGKEPQC